MALASYYGSINIGTVPYSGQYVGKFPFDPYLAQAQQRSQPPLEPQYNFQYEKPIELVERKDFKLMPKNFDWVNESVSKSIQMKGGETKVRKMPRLFRFALYLALIWIVWDIVFNANSIANFVVHTFILHK